MDPRLKLKFQKHPEMVIWTFLSVFSVSKCHLSPRIGIVIGKFVYIIDRNEVVSFFFKKF